MRALMVGCGLLVLSGASLQAETITGGFVVGCQTREVRSRISNLVSAGDDMAVMRYIKQQQSTGECREYPKGSEVRVEQSDSAMTCVAPKDSTEACRWVLMVSVDNGRR